MINMFNDELRSMVTEMIFKQVEQDILDGNTEEGQDVNLDDMFKVEDKEGYGMLKLRDLLKVIDPMIMITLYEASKEGVNSRICSIQGCRDVLRDEILDANVKLIKDPEIIEGVPTVRIALYE